MTAATVTHSIPGRMRVRVTGTRPERARALHALREQCTGRVGCTINSRTGSALLSYDPDELDPEAVLDLAREADTAFGSLHIKALDRLDQPISTAARGVLTNFQRANRSVLVATDGRLDLRMLFPAALGGLAVRQLLRQGVGIQSAPWYVLAYYAFDSYIKLHASDISEADS